MKMIWWICGALLNSKRGITDGELREEEEWNLNDDGNEKSTNIWSRIGIIGININE